MTKVTSIITSVLYACLFTLSAQAKATDTVVVGFISRESQDFYERVVKPYWQQLNGGSPIELISLTPFNAKGEIDLDELAVRIQNAPESMRSIYVHWNEKYDPVHDKWLEALRKKTQSGTRVAFFAGMAKPGFKTIPLSQTLASQVPKALVLGELLEKERLPPLHFYGPELFSAFQINAVVGAIGLAPLNFVNRWARQNPSKDLDESLYELRKKKMKSLRIWPTTDDFFGR
jgi:hypothetical protein